MRRYIGFVTCANRDWHALAEFDFRYNKRMALKVTDAEGLIKPSLA